MIRVLLLEDHASFRQALASIIEREPDVTVVAQAGSLAEARALLPQEVDVLLGKSRLLTIRRHVTVFDPP